MSEETATTALAAMAFEPSANQDLDITADVSITDADGEEITGTLTFDVTPVNDAPTATNTTQTLIYTEGNSSVAIDDIVITEVDTIVASSDDGASETVSVTVTLSDSGAGKLTADSGEGGGYDSSTGVWSISDVSEETASTALAAMAFEPSTNQDVDITADVSITDADGEEITGTLTFDVIPVNDAPTATNTTQTLSYTEGDSSVAIDDIVITEVDTIVASSDDGTSETVSVTVTLSDSGAVSLTADSGEGENYDSSTGVWSISDVSEETASTALAAMAFEPSTNQDLDITADLSITDADGEEITGTLTFGVTPVNDAPTATNTTQTLRATQKVIWPSTSMTL